MKYFYLPFLLFMIFISCEKKIDFSDQIKEPKLVVNSLFKRTSPWKISISKSLGIIETGIFNDIPLVTVKILNDNGTLIEELIYDTNNIYVSPSASSPIINTTYKIEVSSNSFKTVMSKTKIPAPVAINSYSINENINQIELTLKDPVGIKNYYSIDVNSSGEKVFLTSTTPFIDSHSSEDINYTPQSLTFNDDLIDGQTTTVKIKYPSYETINSIQLNSLSKEAYLFIKTKQIQEQNIENPFAEPVQVYTNIKNGFGIFAGYSSSNEFF